MVRSVLLMVLGLSLGFGVSCARDYREDTQYWQSEGQQEPEANQFLESALVDSTWNFQSDDPSVNPCDMTLQKGSNLVYHLDLDTENSWIYEGNQIIIIVNHYSYWVGTLLDENTMRGTTTNLGGMSWKWEAKRIKSPTYQLSRTVWHYETTINSRGEVEFLDGGDLIYYNDKDTVNSWKQNGDKVEFIVNQYSFWYGTIQNKDYMSGMATNLSGEKWDWKAIPKQNKESLDKSPY